nr:biotin--[acetyl-CoA-carboxylase] ligase [candidate division Zixibacteria bacterium]
MSDKKELLADKILHQIRPRPGRKIDPVRLAKSLKVPKEEFEAAVGLLGEWGYKIKSGKKGLLTLTGTPDSLLAEEIYFKLKTKSIGRKVYAYRSVQSTNTIAAQLVNSSAPEGTVVIAEHQTRGRGRLGRSWHSPEKVGIYCSIILKPRLHPTLAPGISLIAAIAVADTIASFDNLKVRIKWPNDVLIDGKKTAGILTELSAELDRIKFAVVGIGVNVNHKAGDFPEDIRDSATSISIELKKEINRIDFVQRLLYNFEKQYIKFKKYGLEKSRKQILAYSSLIKQNIKLRVGRKTVSGQVLDIDEIGRLVIETENGIERFMAGEVTMHMADGHR